MIVNERNLCFIPNKKEQIEIQDWIEEHIKTECEVTSWWNCKDWFKKTNELRTYSLTICPNSIATGYYITCNKCNAKKDITDYECW